MKSEELHITFDASITVVVNREEFERTVDEYRESNPDLTEAQAIDEYVFDMASDLDGDELYCAEGDAWVTYVDNGQLLDY